VTWSTVAEAPAVSLTVLLTPERAKASGMKALAPVLTVSNRSRIVVAEPNNLFILDRKQFLLDTPTPVSDCAFTPDGALLMISGRTLGYCAGGRFHPQIDLPEHAMRLTIGQQRIYVYGGDNDKATALYVVDPQHGHAKLCALPHPIGAASVFGETLYFSAANEVYRLVPGDEMNLICHVPGPAITSLTAAGEATLYFTAGRTLYTWQTGKVGIISEGVGDMACWRDGALYVLDTEKRSLIKLEDLPSLGELPHKTP
jgi:hypothetical protein